MRIELLAFQEERTAELLGEFHSAADEYQRRGKAQALALSAPTGSGKTVMATALIEQLLFGDAFGSLGEYQDDTAGDESFVFLWLTDQPELNEQTAEKMRTTAPSLDGRLVTIGEDFDEELLEAGNVYFLNTQKLGRGTSYVRTGDDRTYTLWQTINNTVLDRPSKLVLIIDEAHRGMLTSSADRAAATTLVQRLVKGASDDLGEVAAVPLIVGISATIERFRVLMGGTTRTQRSVEVSVEEVRESGLVKEVADLKHVAGAEHTDVSLLAAAADEWLLFRQHWRDYADAQSLSLADPILLVQVSDGTRRTPSRTDLALVLKTLQDRIPDAEPKWFAHAFQEGSLLDVDGFGLRYLRPSEIDSDPDVRIVLFKTSLNTGWDCPRAEVMMSFRVAQDSDMIAQLVGRMVRARLARRIDDDEFLNTVSLYLPNFDDAALTAVIDQLNGDTDAKVATRARRAGEVVPVRRASGGKMATAFATAETLPTYTLPPRRAMKPIVRLFKLARLLAEAGWESDPIDTAKSQLRDALIAEHSRLAAESDYAERLAALTAIEEQVRRHEYGAASRNSKSVVGRKIELSASNLDDRYKDAERAFGGEGLNNAYMAGRRAAGGMDDAAIKQEFCLLAGDALARRAVDEAAHTLTTRTWIPKFARRFAAQATPEELRQRFVEVQGSAPTPEVTTLALPHTQIEWAKSTTHEWQRHLFVGDDGRFVEDFAKSSWERLVIAAELARPDVVAWLRNVDRKPWALKLVYQVGTEWVPVYPDFLVFRSVANEVVADIIDPHLLNAPNTPERARGLAVYADQHWGSYGRIELIIVEGSGDQHVIRRLDLMDEDTRKEVGAVSTSAELQRIFERSAPS